MDFFFAAYPDEAACHAALDDYFSSVEALIGTDYYDVLGHIIYPLRYMPFPISLERWRDRIRGILETVVSKGKGIGGKHLPGPNSGTVAGNPDSVPMLAAVKLLPWVQTPIFLLM